MKPYLKSAWGFELGLSVPGAVLIAGCIKRVNNGVGDILRDTAAAFNINAFRLPPKL
jgi:hypothetical protein